MIDDRKELRDTWHRGMTDIEREIYFCNMSIISARRGQDDDRQLACTFGLTDGIIMINDFHKREEKFNMERLQRLETIRDLNNE